MRLLSMPAIGLAAALAIVGLPGLEREGTPPAAGETLESWSGLQLVRTMELDKIAFSGPTGLDWNERLGALVATESAHGRSRVTAFTGDENLIGRVRLPRNIGAGGVVVDPGSGRASVVSETGSVSVGRGSLRRSAPNLLASGIPDLPDPEGLTYSRDGELLALDDGALLQVDEDGGVERTPVDVPSSHQLRGLTSHPQRPELFTLDVTAQELLALDEDGNVLVAYAADEVDLIDVQDIAFAPSGDPTDDPSVQRLFIADAGKPGADGTVLETTLEQYGLAANHVIPESAIRVVATSSYNPPSPDPSGIAYLTQSDRLFISDGEVDEMDIFANANLFQTTRAGGLQTTGNTVPWSEEPVGVGYNSLNNHLFLSDDDPNDVFELTAGNDGRFGTADDTRITWNVEDEVTDPEGIDYDAATNSLWYAGGEASDLHKQQAGSDGQLGTNDDVWTHWDSGIFGLQDPEGLGVDSVRGTILVLDDASQTIYELDRNAALLNTIDISATESDAAAGLAVGPSTTGSGRSFYVVARGVDNNSDPDENDGRLYEIISPLSGGGGGPFNQAPLVSAGNDRSVILPSTVTMAATVTDDGLPNPPASVTTTWSVVSGPGPVNFSPSAQVEDPTVSFQTAGTYVLRLTADDGGAIAADDVVVQVAPVGGSLATEVRVSASSDDAEQALSNNSVQLSSGDLELTTDGTSQQVVGLRFGGLQVPQGATITNAYVQFRTDETSPGAANLTIRAENVDNAPTYTAAANNIGNRATTAANVVWTPPDWTAVGEAGTAQRTPNLASVLQAVVGRAGWAQGNALALQLRGTGRRTAEAFEGGASFAPLLHVEYTTGSGGPSNTPPVVNAGADQPITLPATASLDGTVTDDGLPNPPGALSTTWSRTSGPGTVTFGNPNAVDTTATFSTAGTYVLRLTANDNALTAQDEVTVTVNPATGGNTAPVVDAGADQAITLPASASLDGTVSDDGLPNPPGAVTTGWSRASGPGTVTFGNPNAVDTTATFSAPGTYVLQLTANDGALGASDSLTVVVNPANTAPVVNAGGDQTITLPATAAMAATVTDDGLPTPPAVTYLWATDSGPASASFSSATVEDPSVTFPVAGTYVLRLTANDGALSASDTVQVVVNPAGGGGTPQTVEVRVSANSDDAEQTVSSGAVQLSSSDLELTTDGTTVQVVGVRFGGLQVPQGATITNAYVQFRTDEVSTGASSMTIRAENVDNAPTYTAVANNISSRATTTANVAWTPPAWSTVNEAGLVQRTPNLTSLVQAVVSRAGWAQGNALAMQFSGTGRRTADAFEDGAAFAPLLHVEYTGGSGGPSNTPPLVNAGTDQAITLPAGASLDGTVTDDGLPTPPGTVTTTWTRTSGPGTVTFGNPNAVDTSATFSTSGTYVLRLTATDSALTAFDEVTVTVNPATPGNLPPVVDAGPNQAITLPATALMAATVTDDGIPPPAVLTYLWSTDSGPATASFSSATVEDPTVTFPVAGTYVLRLTASDGALSASDTVQVIVNPAGGGGTPQTLELRVATGSDDAEQSTRSGNNALTSDDLEITTDGNTVQLVGVRFANLAIPKNATITNAYVQFRVDGVSTAATSLTIRAENADNTPTYTTALNNISSRATTGTSVGWVPAAWPTVGAAGEAQRTPDLSALVQAVVNRAGWAQGNAVAFQLSGSGMRKAVAFEGGAGFAPLLHVEYTVP